MMDYFYYGSLMTWLSYIPFYILKLAGITYAIMRRKAHPQVSLAAGIYFAGSLIFSILEIGLSSVIPAQFMKNGYGAQEMTVALSFVSLFSDVIQFGFAIVLLFAIFGWREEKKPNTGVDLLIGLGNSNVSNVAKEHDEFITQEIEKESK